MTRSSLPLRNLADVEAIEQVPLEERISARSTYEMIRQGVALNPDKPALHFFLKAEGYAQPVTITYRQLLGRIHQTANLLRDLGVGPTDVVSFLLPNLPQTHFLIWGGEAAGIVNPINPLLAPAQIKEILLAARTKVLVALGPVPGTDIWAKVEALRREIPTLEAVLQVMGPGDEKEGIYSYDALVERYPADRLESGRQIAPDEIASLFHTGGTTGTPKLARHTHWNEVTNAWMIALAGDLGPEDTLLCGLPLFHVNGVIVTGLAPFSVGGTVVLLTPSGYRDREVIARFWKIVEHYRATFFSAVPTVFAALLNVPMQGEDVSSLRYAICGAAPMPVEVFKAFEAQTGIKILEGYGLTEGTCASSANPRDGERRIGSIGIRFPYQPMKVVKLDAEGRYERDCAPNEIGVIVIKGPNVFPGYVQEEHNRKIWVDDGWLNTGDLGRQDEDGYFWITGRLKDLIIRGGHNIDPAVIEEALHRHPAVALAAAVGKPDAYAGELPVAYVALKPGAQVSAEELLEHCRREIPERAAVPKEILFLDRLPLTAVGKIFKPQLRWDAARRAYTEALAPLAEAGIQVEVQVGPHPVHGAFATVTVSGVEEDRRAEVEDRIQEILGRYAVKYRVVWG